MNTPVLERVREVLRVLEGLGQEPPMDKGYVGFFGRCVEAVRFEHNCKISAIFNRGGSVYRVEFQLTTALAAKPGDTIAAAHVIAAFQGRLPAFTEAETQEVAQALETIYGKL